MTDSFVLGGFPYDCYDSRCTTADDCLVNGCARGERARPMPLAEFDQCCGQCLVGVALESYGAIAPLAIEQTCENCPLLADQRRADERLREARAD